MSDQPETPTPRREFLGQIAASAIVLAGTACAAPAGAGSSAPSPAPTPPPTASPPRNAPVDATGEPVGSINMAGMHWDDSWTMRLTAKHKAVFDSPEISDGFIAGPAYAARYLTGLDEALGVKGADAQVVIVIRHQAIPFAFNDAMWAKYGIGERLKIKSGDKWATANPMGAMRPPSKRPGANPDAIQPRLEWFNAHGHVLLGCGIATQGWATTIAHGVGGKAQAVFDELKANLVPGLILQPNGVYAVLRAQEAGCVSIRAG